MIILLWLFVDEGQFLTETGYSSINKDMLDILENNIEKCVCDDCIYNNVENSIFDCHEDRYVMTQENFNFNFNLS